MKTILSLAVTALLIIGMSAQTPAHAQDTTTEIDAIFGWATPATPGCAVAVSHYGEVVVNRGYGLADLERNVPIRPETVFDVGSVMKQFVAAAVLILVDEGQLALSDDVRTYIPELPDSGHVITLDHLLTHTSGVRDWTGILPLATTPADALTITLRQRGLNFAPGDEWSYSNSGYVLIRGRRAHERHVVRRIHTDASVRAARDDDDHVSARSAGCSENRALAYEQEGGRWRLDMLLDDDRGGGGGLLSTTGDLLIWNDALTSGRLGAFVTEKIQEPARLNNGRTLDYARGLVLDSNRGGRVVWHSGSAAAYNSLLARYLEQGLSIAILCNAGDIAETSVFARRIFDHFVPATGEADAGAEAASAAAQGTQGAGVAVPDLSSREGLYFSDRTGLPLRLVVERDTLHIAGGPPLIPVAHDRFRTADTSLWFMSQGEFELNFVSHDEFEMTSTEGETTTYRRAQPYAPTPAELEGFAGEYESDEIGAVFQVAAGEGGLVVRLAHAQAATLTFRPVALDTFQSGNHLLRFRRDATGTVVALGYSNPVLRDVTFTRLSDRADPR